jgi:hypothetical protein
MSTEAPRARPLVYAQQCKGAPHRGLPRGIAQATTRKAGRAGASGVALLFLLGFLATGPLLAQIGAEQASAGKNSTRGRRQSTRATLSVASPAESTRRSNGLQNGFDLDAPGLGALGHPLVAGGW